MSDLTELDGTFNFRDLGGLPLTDGGTTAAGVLYRSDALHSLTPRGIRQLGESPVGTVVDFRTAIERDTARDRLPGVRRLRTHHLPLLEGAVSHLIEQTLAAHARGDAASAEREVQRAVEELPTLADMYAGMLSHGAPAFAAVAELVADGGGAVLIHCTAGKDRTGVCAAVLLDAAGVERDAIVADYALSHERLSGAWFDRMRGLVSMLGLEVTPPLAELLTGSPPSAMQAALADLDARGGAAEYLRSGGATPDTLARLRSRLTGR